MTRILAIDTSTWWGSVALVEWDAAGETPRVVTDFGQRVDGSHTELLLDWISRCLAQAEWPKTSIDVYAATRGPGSFTGIRVALGTVRGLGLAAGRPCLGVNTLAAIAEARGPAARERVPVMDAGRAEFYAARYDARSSPPVELAPPGVAAARDIVADVLSGAEIITGPGTRVELPDDSDSGNVVSAPERLAGAAGRIAARLATPSDLHTPLAPLYIRPPNAVLKRPRR